ncbi:MAG: hypothetical protein K2Y37_15410 [Pirellulales bacterium]|nr:hypothetical protein [Pirellulales bacterium]
MKPLPSAGRGFTTRRAAKAACQNRASYALAMLSLLPLEIVSSRGALFNIDAPRRSGKYVVEVELMTTLSVPLRGHPFADTRGAWRPASQSPAGSSSGSMPRWYSEGMDEKPKRRWFLFRLSTVLILTAIAAWIMVTRPRVGLVYWSAPTVYELVVGYIPEIDDEYWTFEASSWTSTTKLHFLRTVAVSSSQS